MTKPSFLDQPVVNMSLGFLFLFLLLFLLPVAGTVQAEPAAKAVSAAASVRAAESAFAQTMADRDLDRFLGYVDEEAVFFGDTAALRGIAAVAKGWGPLFEAPEAPFSWEPELVEVLDSGTLALSSGPVLDATGALVGRFNSIWRLGPDGHWKVVFDKGSPVCDGQ